MSNFPEIVSLFGTLITKWQVKLPLQYTDTLNGLYLCVKRQLNKIILTYNTIKLIGHLEAEMLCAGKLLKIFSRCFS